jgi:lysozyme family protein
MTREKALAVLDDLVFYAVGDSAVCHGIGRSIKELHDALRVLREPAVHPEILAALEWARRAAIYIGDAHYPESASDYRKSLEKALAAPAVRAAMQVKQ